MASQSFRTLVPAAVGVAVGIRAVSTRKASRVVGKAAGVVPVPVDPTYGDLELGTLRRATAVRDWPAMAAILGAARERSDYERLTFLLVGIEDLDGEHVLSLAHQGPDDGLVRTVVGARHVAWAWEARTAPARVPGVQGAVPGLPRPAPGRRGAPVPRRGAGPGLGRALVQPAGRLARAPARRGHSPAALRGRGAAGAVPQRPAPPDAPAAVPQVGRQRRAGADLRPRVRAQGARPAARWAPWSPRPTPSAGWTSPRRSAPGTWPSRRSWRR